MAFIGCVDGWLWSEVVCALGTGGLSPLAPVEIRAGARFVTDQPAACQRLKGSSYIRYVNNALPIDPHGQLLGGAWLAAVAGYEQDLCARAL
jgi:hypothetical protein